MHTPITAGILSCCLAVALPAQLSGTYTVGAGQTYPTLSAAAAALSAGVSAPVKFVVLPGVYTESVSLATVTGASATNTVTFESLVPGAAKLTGVSSGTAAGTIMFPVATATALTGFYVIDGFEFTGGPAPAIYSERYVGDIEIRNCTFLAGHTTYILNLRGPNSSRWNVHHNKFTLIPGQRGCYLSQIDNSQFHHNDWDLNGCSYGWYAINTNNSRNRCYNNLFHGSIVDSASSYGLYFAASQYDWEVSLNTFVVNPGASGKIMQLGGCCTTRFMNLYGNVFVNLGSGGPFYSVAGTGTVPVWTYYRGDGNVFFSPTSANPTIALVSTSAGNVNYDLAGWQGLTGQDGASFVANPMLISVMPPFDLRPLPGSPIKDKAVAFPGYATLPVLPIENDYAGTYRDVVADVGAYELRPVFGRFGNGCAGSGSAVPEIATSGTLSIPSANFGVTLSNALGGAPGAFLLGTSSTTWGPIRLPYSLGGGCSLQNNVSLVLPIATSGSGAGNGTASVPIPVPNDPTLVGANLYAQWLILDAASASPFGVTTSRSGAIQL